MRLTGAQCLRGHPLPENLIVYPCGARICRRCQQEGQQRAYQKRKLREHTEEWMNYTQARAHGQGE